MLPKFNSRTGEGISCWNCDAYQRYDIEARPSTCDGECRLEPPYGALFISNFMQDQNVENAFTWPYICDGLRDRCSRFTKTTESDLPQSPMSNACREVKPTLLNEWTPWVKPGKQTCWECLHFEPELRKDKAQAGTGSCLYLPPLYRALIVPSIEMGATIGKHPTIYGAPQFWCMRFEQAESVPEYKPDEEQLTPDDFMVQWEERHERLVWLTTLMQKKFRQLTKPPKPKK